MGNWALFASRAHEMPPPLTAGLVRATLTTATTLILKQVIEDIFCRTRNVARLVLPPLVAFLISLALLTAIQALAGIPTIRATKAVPLTVSKFCAFSYAFTMSRHV